MFGIARRYRAALAGRGEEGSALIVAVMVGGICIILSIIVVAQAIHTVRDSGRDRQRTMQVHAAEAGVDAVYALLQSGSYPCRYPATGTVDVLDAPDQTVVWADVSYHLPDGTEVNAGTGCNVPDNLQVTAVITATASSTNNVGAQASTRTMQSQAIIRPPSSGSGYAIYSYSYFSVPNSFQLNSDGVNPADIYARGGFNCTNSATIDGSIFSASGGAQLSNACGISGDLYTRDSVNMTNTSFVDGTLRSSRGGLTMANSARVGVEALLAGSFSRSGQASVGGVQGSTYVKTGQTMADPPDQPLPYIGYEPANWAANGFTIRDYRSLGWSGCEQIKTEMLTVTTPTLFAGNCGMNYSGNNSGQKLKTDVALFLSGGINIANNYELASDNPSQTRRLWIISPAGNGPEPAGWSPASCSGGGINFSNQTNFRQSVNVFLYTCGGIQMANQTGIWGQIYGKQVTVSNNYKMTFVGTPPVGIDLAGGTPVGSLAVDVVYKREIPTSS